ncbi:TetR/AcrR family transcriptional regulator [Patulibacter minatonensis]|uniref:TetR/AcrR family transcriptional regulator n=1 Tax=Patulibacter minatonensis TaxID=298163 RepID=UPI00047BEA49|nr:TetR/AcrR family transcriptional regulator [Patulibacter minatonensis]
MPSSVPDPTSPQYHEHRARLLEGMAAAVRRSGLRGSTVADVVTLARVSRRTFYQHFSDLIDCYLALMDATGDLLLESARRAVAGDGPVHERIDRAIAGYLAMLDDDPELSRSYWTEYHLTGERGLAGVVSANDRTATLLHELAADLRAAAGIDEPLPFEVAVMLTGSLREMVLQQFLHDRPLAESRPIVSWLVQLVTLAPAPRPAAET